MQIEILGVSLPWRFIFTREGPGARFGKRASANQKEVDPFLSGTDVNPFADGLSGDKESAHVQADKSASSWIDLLTGEERYSDSISEPVIDTAMHGGSDLLDFLDDATIQNQNGGNRDAMAVSTEEPSDSSTQQYIKCFKLLSGPQMVCY